MAKTYIKIEKEDIETSIMGENIMVELKDNVSLIFTPEALDELIIDYMEIMDDQLNDVLEETNQKCGCGSGNCECKKE